MSSSLYFALKSSIKEIQFHGIKNVYLAINHSGKTFD